MEIPIVLRKQIKAYEKEGFTVKEIIRRSRHFQVIFHEFDGPQTITHNASCPHALKNNIARFRRLKRGVEA